MVNKVILIGRLTRDPEVRTIGADTKVANFTLAVDRTFKNANGEKEADFIPIVVWRKTAELCERYLTKGSMCAVTGRLQVRSYDANDGTKRYVTEVVADEVQFLSSNAGQAARQDTNYQSQSQRSDNSGFGVPMEGFEEIDDLSLPF